MDVVVVGGSGYTGGELLRILVRHPEVEELEVTSRSHAGKKASMVHQNLLGVYDKAFVEYKPDKIDADVVFLATQHGESMSVAPKLLEKGVKVVDLSADYRIRDVRLYEKFYKKHESPQLLKDAVYGLPELYRKRIKKAMLVANPGCYPTSVLLALAPLAEFKDRIDAKKIVVDSLSGTSGAGAKPSETLHHPEVDENLKPYNVLDHRHRPEMEHILAEFLGDTRISFTPTLAPIIRGIQSNVHVFSSKKIEGLAEHYRRFYDKEYFIRITETPQIKNVANTNFCDIGVWYDENAKKILIISAIDNLIKGASGQAVQNMNVMSGYDEKMGLDLIAGHP